MKDVTIMDYVSMAHVNVYPAGTANFVRCLDAQMTAMVTVNAKLQEVKSGIVFVSKDLLETIVKLPKKLNAMTRTIMTRMA